MDKLIGKKMGCDDTTSLIIVRVDLNELLIDYDYCKITCGREVNTNSVLLELFVGKPVSFITNSTLADVAKKLKLMSNEDQFLLYLEWDALRNAIFQYMGKELQGYSNRYQLAAISYEKNFVEIRQNILPLTGAPQNSNII
jgi:hypothetical protein